MSIRTYTLIQRLPTIELEFVVTNKPAILYVQDSRVLTCSFNKRLKTSQNLEIIGCQKTIVHIKFIY